MDIYVYLQPDNSPFQQTTFLKDLLKDKEDFALSARATSTQVIRRAAHNHAPDINWPRVAALRQRILRRCTEDVTECRVIVDGECARQERDTKSSWKNNVERL
ncbi:hypothetical protein J6590_038234 [Homalodisca vitripennis]|nr:hypothetical protein J6590_038234 [Homalodisca vitripennis]